MNTPNTNSTGAEAPATVQERLQRICDRKNATGHYVTALTPESVLAKMEKECDDLERMKASFRATVAKQEAEKAAERAALELFTIGDKVTFEAIRGRVESGEVVGFTKDGIFAPGLEVWTGSIGQRATGKASCVKPIKDKVNGLHTYMDGDQWCCVDGTFTNLQESKAGFGATEAEAVKAFGAAQSGADAQ